MCPTFWRDSTAVKSGGRSYQRCRHSLAAARGTGGVVRRIDAELAKMNASPALTPDVATKC
eukprot:3924490-Prymnesium_polylepis.1